MLRNSFSKGFYMIFLGNKHLLKSILFFFIFSQKVFSFERQCLVPLHKDLKSLKAKVAEALDSHDTVVHVVLGNESADVDSIAAPIARAKSLSLKSTSPNEIYIPVINIPREQLRLRRDVLYLFSILSIKAKNLVFVDEIPLLQLWSHGRLRLHLVDHNELTDHQSYMKNSVISLVDHHADEKIDYPLCSKKNKIITRVGSVSSLIAKNLLETTDNQLHKSWAQFLLAAVLLDTRNLKNPVKTTEFDLEAANKLSLILPKFNQKKFYKKLLEARSDVRGFTTEELLLKDMKSYFHGGLSYVISSLPTKCHYSWNRDSGFLKSFRNFRKKNGVFVSTILESKKEGSRKFHMHSLDPIFLQQLVFSLAKDPDLAEQVKLIAFDFHHSMATISLPNTMGRKILQPILARIFVRLMKPRSRL